MKKLKLEWGGDASDGMCFGDGGNETITISCTDVVEDGKNIARAVNSFDALVAALSPFRSAEMGDLLVGMIDTRERGGEDAQKRLSKLVSMIDVILEAVEPEDAHDS